MHISLCYYVSQFIKENSCHNQLHQFIRYLYHHISYPMLRLVLRVGQKACETEGGSDTPFRTMAKNYK